MLKYHYQCCSFTRSDFDTMDQIWFCKSCLSEELPFNHYDNDLDFYNALIDSSHNSTRINFHDLNDKILMPFEMNDKYNTNIPLCDVDPDSNFYNPYL